ncbi:MAG: hypothetical protein O7C67_12360 [Gammaproteobacteria bacterium]|nr:hypothetical protein [Gammaproteobacteria bacterium]
MADDGRSPIGRRIGGTQIVSRVREILTVRLPVVIYVLVGLGLLVQGIRYLGAAELMPYHLAVIQTSWENLSADDQQLFLGLLKGFGAGSFGVGLAIILMAVIPLRGGKSWAFWTTPAIALTYTAGLVYVTNFALLPGATPIAVSYVLLGLVASAAVSSFFASKTG